MAKYRKRPLIVDAEQFQHPATSPRGVRTEEDGRAYVVTIHEQKVYLAPGDWVIEEPDRVHYYPCKPEVFTATYEEADAPLGFSPTEALALLQTIYRRQDASGPMLQRIEEFLKAAGYRLRHG